MKRDYRARTFHADNITHERLTALAAQKLISMSALIRMMINDRYAELTPADTNSKRPPVADTRPNVGGNDQ